MAFKGIESYGTCFYISTGTTAGTTAASYTKVGALISLPGPEMATDVVDKSVLCSTGDHFKGKAIEDIDPGEMTPTFAYKKGETGQAKIVSAFKNRTKSRFKITHPTTADFQPEYYTGFVTRLGRSIDKGSVMIRNVGITLSSGKGYWST